MDLNDNDLFETANKMGAMDKEKDTFRPLSRRKDKTKHSGDENKHRIALIKLMVERAKKIADLGGEGENLKAYFQWFLDNPNQNPSIACYCFGMLAACLEKTIGFQYFSKNFLTVLTKEGDAYAAPIRVLHVLSGKEIVSMEGLNKEQKGDIFDELQNEGYTMSISKENFVFESMYARYTLPEPEGEVKGLVCALEHFEKKGANVNSKSFPKKMEDTARKHNQRLSYNNVTSLDTTSPFWKFLEELYGERAYWIEWDSAKSPEGTIRRDAVLQTWEQGQNLTASRGGFLFNTERVTGIEKIMAICTNFRAPLVQDPTCYPTSDDFSYTYSEDENGVILEPDKGEPRLYYDDTQTGHGVLGTHVPQTMLVLKKSNKPNFAHLYGLLKADGIVKTEAIPGVIPPGTFLPCEKTEFWKSLRVEERVTMEATIESYRKLFNSQMRFGFFSPSDLLHEHQLKNHRSEYDPSSWLWCYLILQGGTWASQLFVGTTAGSKNRTERVKERLALLKSIGMTTDEHNMHPKEFGRKVPKVHWRQWT